MSIGSRVFLRRKLPPRELVEGFARLPAANVADCMERYGAMTSDIRLLSGPKRKLFAGVALTVKSREGDNMMIHQALDMAGEGDVIVVSNEGGRDRSLVGGIMFSYARSKGVEGMVIDGPVRDLEELCGMDWHVYATGATPGGPYKMGPGEINVPISCGGVSVSPGDIILGDMDGVVVIPREDAQALLELAVPYAANDARKMEKAVAGTSDRKWVGKLMEEKKVAFIDGTYEGRA